VTSCVFCGSPTFGYIHAFLDRRKTASYSACLKHFAMVWAYQEFGQGWLREALTKVLPVRKGRLPRLKVSFSG
jgi:hypothetical protein